MRILSKWPLRIVLTALIAGIALGVTSASSAGSSTSIVDCDAGDSLQLTIDGASPGNTITIAAGTCTENLTIDKDLTLSGAGDGVTILEAPAFPGGGVISIPASDVSVVISGVTVRGGAASGIQNIGGTVTLTSTTITGNMALFDGGGIYNFDGGSLTLVDSTVSDNAAGSIGGGIFNDSGTVTLIGSTVSGNTAGNDGGGIYNFNGQLTFTNSTVSGNEAGRHGGGIISFFSGATVALTNSTISGNVAAEFGGGVWNGGPLTLEATIVADNAAAGGPDCDGSLVRPVSLGYNLVEDTSGCGFTVAATDLVGVDPLLGPLADNGGPTLTHALLWDSPAIDHIPLADCAVATDQRGVDRPADGVGAATCDIGAYEFIPYVIYLPLVNR